jgi:hypothetical protein
LLVLRFVADVLGCQPQLSMASCRTNLPACAEILRSKALESDETMLDHELKGLEMQNVLPPKSPPSQSPPSGVSSTGGVVNDDAYLGARFR